jgi:transposase
MYLRRCVRKKCGKEHVYWQLVESVRTVQGIRQRTVAYLGELRASEQTGWARLAANLDAKAAESVRQLALFRSECDSDAAFDRLTPPRACRGAEAEPIPEQIKVDVRGVEVSRVRDFGDVYLGLALWRALGLHDLLRELLPDGREEVPWDWMAAVLAVARFAEPDSELHVEEHWYERTVLSDILGVPPEQVNDSRLYRTLDQVLPLKAKIEEHLRRRAGEMFSLQFDLLLYDITSTYFEGLAEQNGDARRGYSRDHRPDCKQVCIGLVVTPDGFPLAYEVFAGNTTDVTTVEDMVEAMEAKYGRARRVWVVDRGMVSEENLEFLRERGAQYLVGTPKSLLRRFERELLDKDWHTVREGIEVKLVPSPDGTETFVVCRSADRIEKEKAIHDRFAKRIEAGLARIAERLEKARRRIDPVRIERRIGKLLGQNSRAAGGFQVNVIEDGSRPSGQRLEWTHVAAWQEWASLSEGCYILRTNLAGKTPEELWQTYIQLTQVESAFRTVKTDLRIRPIWHQKKERVEAHILFSFLAYAMWKTLEHWAKRAGLGNGVRIIIEELRRIKACDVILPTTANRRIRLSCVTRPDEHQQAILDRLALPLPGRLCRPQWVTDAAKTERPCSEDFCHGMPGNAPSGPFQPSN